MVDVRTEAGHASGITVVRVVVTGEIATHGRAAGIVATAATVIVIDAAAAMTVAVTHALEAVVETFIGSVLKLDFFLDIFFLNLFSQF